MDTLTIISLVILVVMIVGLGLLLRRQSTLQTALADGAAVTELQHRCTVAEEQLKARDEELLRERKSSSDRQIGFKAEEEGLQRQLEDIRGRLTQSQQNLAAVKTAADTLPEIKAEREVARDALTQSRESLAELQSEFEALKARTDEERQAAADKLNALEKAEERLTTQFENLANRIFDEKHQKFSKESKESVENLLAPVKQQLTDFKAKVEEVYREDTKDRTSLRDQIDGLKGLHQQMSDDALNLTRALKGDSKKRGNWGEVQLEMILEGSGLAKGREYETQGSYRNEAGDRLQPDVVVHLPESKDIVIDSKVSLVDYDSYHRSDTDVERLSCVNNHIASIRTHINGLSAKSYDQLIGVNTLDLVIMFVPIEPAFLLALESDSDLYNYAFKKGILLVSPTTLMGTLQIINNIWRYEYQNRNVQEIAKQGGGLYDQFVLFAESLNEVGKALEKAKDSYNTANKRLTSGKGNLVGRIEKLQKLGAMAKKQIPKTLLDAANEADDDLEADLETPALTSGSSDNDQDDIET